MSETSLTAVAGAANVPFAPKRSSANIQSVDRALTLLELLAEMGGYCTLGALARRSGLNVSTCHHLLATLLGRGYVTQMHGDRSYALGSRILHLSRSCVRRFDLAQAAARHLDSISRATGETVHLAVMQGTDLVTILHREARHAVRVDTGTLGKSHAAHATATGKAILAWLPEPEIRRIIAANGMARFTPNTLTDEEALLMELRQVRRNQFAVDREEFQPHVICIGAAIRDHLGAVVGAISASTPTMRADDAHFELLRQEVVAAATNLSAEIGNEPAPREAEAAD